MEPAGHGSPSATDACCGVRRGGQLLGRACATVTRDPVGDGAACDDRGRVREGRCAHPPAGFGGAVPGADGDTVYVGCRGGGLKRSTDGGDSFEELPLPERDVFSVAVSAADGAVYVGTEPSRLFRSRDGGESWEELVALQEIPSRADWSFPPRPWTSHVRWIAPSPHDREVVLVGIELGGLMRTDDGGASFSDHRPEAARDVHCLAWHPSAQGRAYEAGGDGAALSRDGGRSWQRADAGETAATPGRWPSTRPIRSAGSSRRPPARSRRTGAARPTRRSTAGRAPAPGRRSPARSTPTSTLDRTGPALRRSGRRHAAPQQ